MVKRKCSSCGIVEEIGVLHPLKDGTFLCVICSDADKVWDKWRNGEITHDEVQTELDKILPQEPKGFFKNLEEEIQGWINSEIPESGKSHNIDAYFNRRASINTKLVKETNLTDFWQRCQWLAKPTETDLRDLSILCDDDLTEYHILIFHSLIDLAKQDLENTESCKNLHEFYKLTKSEMIKRGILSNPDDAFEEYLQDREAHKSQAERMEEARKTGEFCPHCDSKNIISDGHSWRCKDCKKRFRKRL